METPSAENLAAARALGEQIDNHLATRVPIKVEQLGDEPLSGQRSGDEPGTSEIYLVTFPDGQAFFKPLDGVDEDIVDYYDATAESVAVAEIVAVAIARQLGAPCGDMVTPTVLREINGATGTLSWRLEGGTWLAEQIPADQLLPAGLLDSIIGNQDRHMGNYLFDPAAKRLGLFDHGFTFAVPGSYINANYLLDARIARGDSGLSAQERKAIDALDLDLVAAALTTDRLAALTDRLDHMRDTGTVFVLDDDADTDSTDFSDYSEGTT